MSTLEATRLQRGARPSVRRVPPTEALDAPQRLALFLCAVRPTGALDLLEGLAPCVRSRARDTAREVSALTSPARQAILTRAFGRRAEAVDRLKTLLVEASPPLRRAIAAAMPTPWRGLVAHLEPSTDAPPAMRALAARLVREALRAA